MPTKILTGQDAWNAVIKTDKSRWGDDIARFDANLCSVVHKPKFTFDASTSFFCMGSCFARNVEEHLIYAGQRVLSKQIICPEEEWPNRVNGFVNKFTTHSMANELIEVRDRPHIDEACFEETAQGWLDLQLCAGVRPTTLERAMQRRGYLTTVYFDRIRQADIVVLTLGLNEVWFDHASAKHLNAAPSFASVKRMPDRYALKITDPDSNIEQLETIRSTLRGLNPHVRMIVTVSPVPLGETFSGRDVAVANMYSKSVLRVAAGLFAECHSDVDYFPSFEMISLSPRMQVYAHDCLHVADEPVRKVIGEFLTLYTGLEIAPASFNEGAYLRANPDVKAAVHRGEIESGFQHWQMWGRAEGRPMPENGIHPLALAAAARR